MVQFSTEGLSAVFAALADPTRRAVVERLAADSATAGELAEPFGMSLTGFMKHLGILESAGIVVRRKEGRVVHCALAPLALADAHEWLDRQRRFWEDRLDALERYLEREERKPWPREPRKSARRSRSSGASRRRPPRSSPPGRTRKR